MKSIFDAIVAAGVPYDHHESDLYVPNTKIVRERAAFETERNEL